MIDDLQIRAVVHLSSTAVQTVVGYVDAHDKKLKIMAIGHVDTDSFFGGMIVDYQKLLQALKLSVKQAADMVNLDFKDVGLSFATPAMASGQGLYRINLVDKYHPNASGRPLRADDVEETLKHIEDSYVKQRYSLIQCNTLFMVIDQDGRMLKNAIGMSAHTVTLAYHVHCVPHSYYQQINHLFAKSGLGIHPSLFSGVAGAEYALYPKEKEQGVCFIDIGTSCTNVCVYAQNILLFSYCFDFGGHTIDAQISKWLNSQRLNISLEEAAYLKEAYGSAFSENVEKSKVVNLKRYNQEDEVIFYVYELCLCIEEQYCQLMNMILNQIKEKQLTEYIHSNIVLSGGGTNMKGLDTLIEKKFNISVRKSSQNHTIGVCAKYLNDDNIRLVKNCLKDSKFNNAIGALLYQYSEPYQRDEQLRYPKEQPTGLFKRVKKIKTQFDKLKNWM